MLRRAGGCGTGRRSGRWGQERRPVLKPGAGEGVRRHRRRRPPAGVEQLLCSEGGGDYREGTPPSEEDLDLFVVRTRFYQVEDDPVATGAAAGLPCAAWLNLPSWSPQVRKGCMTRPPDRIDLSRRYPESALAGAWYPLVVLGFFSLSGCIPVPCRPSVSCAFFFTPGCHA